MVSKANRGMNNPPVSSPHEERNTGDIEYPIWLRAIKDGMSPKFIDKSCAAFVIHGESRTWKVRNWSRNIYEKITAGKYA